MRLFKKNEKKEGKNKKKTLKRVRKFRGGYYVAAESLRKEVKNGKTKLRLVAGVLCGPPDENHPAAKKIIMRRHSWWRINRFCPVRWLTDWTKTNGGQTWFDLPGWGDPCRITLFDPKGKVKKTIRIKNEKGVVVEIRKDSVTVFRRKR